MPNKNYISGRKFEYDVRDFFEERGYTVIRSAGSHTPIDLVVFDRFGVLLIQCKNKKIHLSEIKDFIALSKRYDEYDFYVATSEKKGRKKNIVIYLITPTGNLIRKEWE